VWPSRWRNTLTVASLSSIAATISPFLCGLLLTYDNPVTIHDCGIDHRLADNFEHEQFALADELAGERKHLVDHLVGGDGDAGRDSADERHHHRVADLRRRLWGVILDSWQFDEHLEGAGAVGVATKVAAELELVELVGDAR